jgi:stage II sporulation protein B
MGGGQSLDKPGNHKTITIKINGKDRPIAKDKKHSSPEELDKEILHFKDIEKLSSQESAAAQEVEEEDEFDWILPELDEDEDLQEYKIISNRTPSNGKVFKNKKSTLQKPKNKGVLPSILLTVFLAVLLGTSLGVLMLKMVLSDSAMEAGTAPTEEVPPTDGPLATPGTASVEKTTITGYVIQGGAFSNAEAAGIEATGMTEKGLPAKVIEMNGTAYLFVGIADNLPNAKSLGAQLQGVETFAKEVTIGGGNKTNLLESEKQTLELAPTLFGTISQISSSASLTNTLPSDLQDSLNTQLEQWNSLKGIEDESIKQLKGEIDGAITSIKNFEKNKDSSLLVKIQQHLLNFLSIYHTI